MSGIVQLIEVSPDFSALPARQLHGIGKNTVACLLPVELPCVVWAGVFEKNVALPEAMRPGRAGKPQKRPVLTVGACSSFVNDLLVNLKIASVKAGVLLHHRIKASQYIHVFKLLHTIRSFPNPAFCSFAPFFGRSAPLPPEAAPGSRAFPLCRAPYRHGWRS